MDFIKWVREGIARPRVAIYLKVMAVLFFSAAFSHLASIMGLIDGPWVNKPWYFRTADPVLLLVDLVIAWGLWRPRFWAVVGWLAAVVFLQAIPMLLLIQFSAPDPRQQVTWYYMLATHAVTLGVFLLLLRRKKNGGSRGQGVQPG